VLVACSPSPLRQAQGDTLGAVPNNGGILSGAPQARSGVILSEGAERRSRRTVTSIQHVVFVIQENRSFNNLFMGFPGATTATFGYDNTGTKIELRPINLSTTWDVGHDSKAYFADCDGQGSLPGTDCKMDGWNQGGATGKSPKNAAFAYVKKSQIAPYWTMAKQYVLADDMLASNLDGSFIAHQYAIAAYASHAVDFPAGIWGCGGGSGDLISTLKSDRTIGPRIVACFDNPSIGSEADAAGVSWRSYAGSVSGDGSLWNAYQAISPIYYGPDWKADVISPPSQFLSDIAAGTLANITWITPTFEASDHPGMSASQGPSWVTSIVDAVGTSKFWNSTAIFIIWDDWGGMFDPVQPVYEDYDGLGFRIPLIAISPYAKNGSVTHTQYETASVLRFIEDNFGLAQLNKADARANDPAADATVFNFQQRPRKFKQIAGSKPAAYWLHEQLRTERRQVPKTILGDD
jgi:phospholipase C